MRPDGDLCLRRCAGNREAKRGTCCANRIGWSGCFAEKRRRLKAARSQLLIDGLVPDMANLAGRFRRAVVIVPDRGRKGRRKQEQNGQSDWQSRANLGMADPHGYAKSV